MRQPKVFISYSHDSKGHKNRVFELSERLRSEGVDCHMDQYEMSPAEGWPKWMRNQIRWADFVLVDRDLTRIAPETIRDARVLMTIVGGKVVYEREGTQPVTP